MSIPAEFRTGGDVTDRAFYVMEAHNSPSGQCAHDYASGRLEDADEACQACAAMREADPGRALYCVEVVSYD